MAQIKNEELSKWKKEIEAELSDTTLTDALQEEVNILFTRLQVVAKVEMRLTGGPGHAEFIQSFVQPIQQAYDEKNALLTRTQHEQWRRQTMLEHINNEISTMLNK